MVGRSRAENILSERKAQNNLAKTGIHGLFRYNFNGTGATLASIMLVFFTLQLELYHYLYPNFGITYIGSVPVQALSE